MIGPGRPAPGAVGLVGGGGLDTARARQTVEAAFRAHRMTPQVVIEGPLALAWAPGPTRGLHSVGPIVCLLEGTLYELGDLRRVAGQAGPPEKLLALAYSRLGGRVLPCLRGEFWAALWDRRTRRGILVCDQLGSRAPFWARSGTDVMFASEIPELLTALPARPGPDPVSMTHWLTLSAPPEGRTLFAGIRRLEAGHLLDMEPGQAALRRYWDPTSVSSTNISKEDAIGGLRAALERSVRRRIADAPAAGVLLSGGLDSSAIAAMLSVTREDGQGQLLEAYSATFPDHPGADESDLIDRTTRHLGLQSTRIVVREGGVVGGMLGYLASWGVPPTSPNLFFWMPLLERAASDGMKVMLDGEGGDEVFGLSPYLLADRIRHGRLLAAIELATRFPGSADPAAPARVWRLLRRWGLKGAMPAGSHQMARRLRGGGHYTPSWLRPAMARLWLETEAGYAWKASPGPRWRAFLGDAMTGLGPRWVYEQARRRTAMWGIEARHPLVDVDVVELIMQLPPELAFDPQASRPLLRGSVDRLLPDEVRLRPAKASFDAVFFSGLTGPDLAAVRLVLEPGDAEIGAYVDLSAMRRLLLDSDPPTDRWKLQPWATTVWRLLTAECWLRSQSDLDFPARLAESGLLSAACHELSGSDDTEVVDKPPKTL